MFLKIDLEEKIKFEIIYYYYYIVVLLNYTDGRRQLTCIGEAASGWTLWGKKESNDLMLFQHKTKKDKDEWLKINNSKKHWTEGWFLFYFHQTVEIWRPRGNLKNMYSNDKISYLNN